MESPIKALGAGTNPALPTALQNNKAFRYFKDGKARADPRGKVPWQADANARGDWRFSSPLDGKASTYAAGSQRKQAG